MVARDCTHKRKVRLWLTVILFNIVLIGGLWYMDAHDIDYIKDSWITWVTECHFLLRISIWMMYIVVVWYIIHWGYKLFNWFVGILLRIFY